MKNISIIVSTAIIELMLIGCSESSNAENVLIDDGRSNEYSSSVQLASSIVDVSSSSIIFSSSIPLISSSQSLSVSSQNTISSSSRVASSSSVGYSSIIFSSSIPLTSSSRSLSVSSQGAISSSSQVVSSSSVGYNYCEKNPSLCGVYKDLRNNQDYPWVMIGTQKWMARNLNFDTANGTESWCYKADTSMCKKFGRLYQWQISKFVCPNDWHLPSKGEWASLMSYLSKTFDVGISGILLKSKNEWSSGAGNDSVGFGGLPGGYRYKDGTFEDLYYSGYWWTSTKTSMGAEYYYLNNSLNVSGNNSMNLSNGLSIRCIHD